MNAQLHMLDWFSVDEFQMVIPSMNPARARRSHLHDRSFLKEIRSTRGSHVNSFGMDDSGSTRAARS